MVHRCGTHGKRLRRLLLLDAQCRSLSRSVRPRGAGLVLPARPAARPAAVDATPAGPGAFPVALLCETTAAGARLLPAGVRLGVRVLLRVRLQTTGVHPAGAAASGSWRLGCHLNAITSSGSRLAFPASLVALLAGLGIVLAAAGTHFIPLPTALILAATALTGLTILLLWRQRGDLANRRRRVVRRLIGRPPVPVARVQPPLRPAVAPARSRRPVRRPASYRRCYPQRWDSVSFYLPNADVKVYAATEQQQLFAELRGGPRVLLAGAVGQSAGRRWWQDCRPRWSSSRDRRTRR